MESSSTATRFRFRESENSNHSDTSSSSISSISCTDNGGDESNLQSMAGKGIKRLCAELLEIKALSDEDFHRNIFTNYSAFLGVFEDAKDMEMELMKLKTQVSAQKGLVKELIDGMYLKLLSEETMKLIIEESDSDEPPLELEVHIDDVSEILDTLLSENRMDEAVAILEMEEENLKKVLVEFGNTPSDVLMLYKSVISERKAMLTLELTLVAENSRISAPELQKALVGICRLGESHLATQLLLKYYHIASGIHDMQNSKTLVHGMYVRELSRFVFSMISQAAKSFTKLHGETSPFASEFVQWVYEEIEVFAVSFAKYVLSVSEVSSRLSTAVESVQFALSYCSLLESQRLVLRPCLIEHIRPCMEEVLQMRVGHFKKVIGIFSAADTWVLGRYLLSGTLNGSYSSMVVGEQPEYCLLTSSGRKFVTVLQAVTGDVTPLAALQLEDSILRGLVNLFSDYTAILERAITSETNELRKSGSGIILAETVPQQVSVLANLSTLEKLFSSTILSVFESNNHTDSELMKNQAVCFHQQELESCVLFVQDASARLRAHFCQQFIRRMMSSETGCKLTHQKSMDSEGDHGLFHIVVPSVAFQVLFLELRKLGKLAADDIFEMDWLMELLRELIEAIFVWISNDKEIWENNEENLNFLHPDIWNQFVLDMHFLVEMIRFGEYFSTNPLVPATLMKSVFDSAGLDPTRDAGDGDDDDGWVMRAALEAIERLLEIEETDSPSDDEFVGISVEEPPENLSERASETVNDDGTSSSEDSLMLGENVAATDAIEVAVDTGNVNLNAELNHAGQSPDLLKDKDCSISNITTCLTDISGDMEDTESRNAASDKFHLDQETTLPHLQLSVSEASEVGLPTEVVLMNQHNETEVFVIDLKGDGKMNFPGSEIVSGEDSTSLQGHDK